MEVILLEKIENLGGLGDKVSVRPGYARNFLIPQNKAKFATAANIAEFEERRAELEKLAAQSLSNAEARKAALENLVITIPANAGNEGKLFGSVGGAEIAAAVEAAGVKLEKREIRLPEGPLRALGEFDVDVHLLSDVDTVVKVNIIQEEEEK